MLAGLTQPVFRASAMNSKEAEPSPYSGPMREEHRADAQVCQQLPKGMKSLYHPQGLHNPTYDTSERKCFAWHLFSSCQLTTERCCIPYQHTQFIYKIQINNNRGSQWVSMEQPCPEGTVSDA